jgi:PAS domain S-box-containing protein
VASSTNRQTGGKTAGPTPGHRKGILAPIVFVSILAIATSWGAVRIGENWLLENEALESAVKWATFIHDNVSDLDDILSGNPISEADRHMFELASQAGNVFRYKLFRSDGVIVFASRASDLGTTNTKPYFSELVKKGQTFVKIEDREDFGDDRTVVSEAYVPFMDHDRFSGAIEVYVDMTARAAALRYVGRHVLGGILVLLGVFAAVCGVFVWQNNRDIAERKRAKEELRESEARLQVILDYSPTKIHIKDADGRYVIINRQSEVLFGVTDDEARGKTAHEIFPAMKAASLEEHDRSVLETRQAIEHEEEWLREDGVHTFLTVKFPIFDAFGNVEGTGAIGTDITERKRAEKELLAAKEEAELHNRAKSEFLANMSHELRTPLNAIIGFSDMIRRETFGPVGSPKYLEYVSDINESGTHLLELINDILDLSKIEAGELELHEQDVDVSRVVRSCLTLVKERAEAREIEVKCDSTSDLPGLFADERKLKQILINLLSNAIKFTPTGGKVTIRSWFDFDDGYVFEISDTGIGIAPEDIPNALTPFRQVDNDMSRNYEGTGLGLPLTSALTELHGGSLDLQSEVGVGTTVTVRFPAERILPRAKTGT